MNPKPPPHEAWGFVPPGHYYSPIPDWAQVRADAARIFAEPRRSLPGLDMREEDQLALIETLSQYYATMPFKDEKTEGLRFHFANDSFTDCDAIFLHCMIRHLRPRRIVEIGSGYSSCVTLDTNELFCDGSIALTFIEPYPELLHKLLRPGDARRVTILPQRLQDVDASVFAGLAAGDILFVDSTHVSRIDSDVNRIVFEILPALAPGVHVHFHDMFWPFEYPRAWVEAGRAWNELYLLRAFLEFNQRFRVRLMSSFLAHFHDVFVRRKMPLCMRNSGGNLWLERC